MQDIIDQNIIKINNIPAAGAEEEIAVLSGTQERMDGYRSAIEEPKVVVISRELAQRFLGLQVMAGMEGNVVIAREEPADTAIRLAEQGVTHVIYFGGAEEAKQFVPAANLLRIQVTANTPENPKFRLLLPEILVALGVPERLAAAGVEEFAVGLEALGEAA